MNKSSHKSMVLVVATLAFVAWYAAYRVQGALRESVQNHKISPTQPYAKPDETFSPCPLGYLSIDSKSSVCMSFRGHVVFKKKEAPDTDLKEKSAAGN